MAAASLAGKTLTQHEHRRLDWNFRVIAMSNSEMSQDQRRDFLSVFHCVSFSEQVAPDTRLWLKLPRPRFGRLQYLRDKFKEVRVRSSATIPFDGLPYEAEVNVTQTWKNTVSDRSQPEVSWGVELHGISWEEAINNTGPDGRKKNWGDGLINVWPGEEQSLQKKVRSPRSLRLEGPGGYRPGEPGTTQRNRRFRSRRASKSYPWLILGANLTLSRASILQEVNRDLLFIKAFHVGSFMTLLAGPLGFDSP